MFAEGTVLAGKYRIDRVLGQGGMGTVVAATHLTLGQRVALKLLLAEFVHNQAIVERFVREARASAALRGEHVCRVSDVGAFDDGTPYFVMELLEGRDLASLLAAQGPLPVPTVCDYVLQACVGVAEAHAAGIVHRDLKPGNLFLTQRPDGTPLLKVLDFGIAKAQSDTGFHITRTTSVLGSPGYMSPEQLRSSRDVDVRSDIWSLGVILYELISGVPPFRAESITELAIRVTLDPTPPLVGPLPHGFDQVVNRCLAKDPAQRYPDLANLAHALAAYAGPGSWELATSVTRLLAGPRVSTGGMVPLAPAAPAAPTTMGSAASSMVAARSGGVRWGIIAGMAIAVIGAVIGIAVTRGGDPAEAPAAAATPAAVPAPAPAPVPVPVPDAAPPKIAAPTPDAPAVVESPDAAAPAGKTGKPTGKRPAGKPPVKQPAEDFGESRY